MKEGEFIRKVRGEEKGLSAETTGAKAELHEPCASISVRKPSVRQVQWAGGQDAGGPHDGEWSALPCPATLEPKAKGKKKNSAILTLSLCNILKCCSSWNFYINFSF